MLFFGVHSVLIIIFIHFWMSKLSQWLEVALDMLLVKYCDQRVLYMRHGESATAKLRFNNLEGV